ncbi:MAG: DUF11 domain-containing protein [Chloroflexi bacterium]|nr:DUF11 domain-containing protein [Chloroflexota bacterium]
MRRWRLPPQHYRQDERGSAMIVVLAFLVFVIPSVTAALSFAATASTVSGAQTRSAIAQYTATGGAEHGLYRVVHEAGYADGLVLDAADLYTVLINGRTVNVSVTKLSATVFDPPPSTYNSKQRLYAEKAVTPETASPSTLTTFTYTITVTNGSKTAKGINQMVDELPAGFSYVGGTTTGLTTNDPTVSGQQLEWDVASMDIDLAPDDSVVLSFDAQASVPEGVYCNEAWVHPGGESTSSGKTAGVTVGSPSSSVCGGTAVAVSATVDPDSAVAGVSTTFAFAVVIDNIGSTDVGVSEVRDLLPAGFLYVAGSTGGDLTAQEPDTKFQQGRQRLTWSFSPSVTIPSGESRTLLLEADATLGPGRYGSELRVTVDELASAILVQEAAPVDVLGPILIEATDGSATASMLVWTRDGYYEVTAWDLEGL